MFEEILKQILQHDHVEGVIFLDSEGEEIFSFGRTSTEHLKLMGAYQGIILTSLQRMMALGENRSIITRCVERCIFTQQLKLGYFVCILMSGEANFAHAQFQFEDYFNELEKEL